MWQTRRIGTISCSGCRSAVVQVRLVKRSTRNELDKLERAHRWLPVLKTRVESRLPARFVEL